VVNTLNLVCSFKEIFLKSPCWYILKQLFSISANSGFNLGNLPPSLLHILVNILRLFPLIVENSCFKNNYCTVTMALSNTSNLLSNEYTT
jgi:hypothetical protein